MNKEWNLDKLYKGLDDPKYKADVEKLGNTIKECNEYVKGLEGVPSVAETEKILTLTEEIYKLLDNLFNYVGLRQSTDTENGELIAESNNLQRLYSETTGADAKASKLMALIPSIDDYAAQSELIKEYKFYLEQNKESAKHLLSDAEEELYTQMDMTGGGAWGNLQSFLSSTVKVDYEGKQITLTEARNLAYDADKDVRKKAYDAEIACYDKIADSVAYSLNNIKLQMNMIARKRGYSSALDHTLHQSKMTKETLDAMMGAIEEHLPNIRKYFTHKAKLLGYEGALPWYELFAPLGNDDTKYSVEEAKQLLVNTFEQFSPEVSSLMEEAFDNEWIDFFPHPGKVGGAFDSSVASIGESRVLTNFDGSFGAIDTLAHELGHSFHDRQVQCNRPLNQGYPMQVAETASTFNETHLCNYHVAHSKSNSEKLSLLEGLLKEQTQCIVDIYSRYLFETAVFEQCEDKFLMKDDLKELMLDAQKKAYGEGLDENFMHPYMWCCKSHYYSTGLSFYNFPYAFGALFAAGLYALYLEEGIDTFLPKYKKMLNATPVVTVEGAGKLMGIDLTDKKFWENSLKLIEKSIDEFCSL